MEFLEVVQTYFRGERLESSLFVVPGGIILIGLGIAAIRSETPAFAWSVAVPCFLFGLLFLGVGVGISLRTPGQVAALLQGLETDAPNTLAAEIARMDKVLANFHLVLPTLGVIAFGGLVLRFGVSADWAQGLGPILVLIGGLGLLSDGFASRRALPYIAALAEERDRSGAEEQQRGETTLRADAD